MIQKILKANAIWQGQAPEDIKADISFGEYANPSFESQIETISKARTGQIMSIEALVEELYGDSRDQKWKTEEIARLKAEQGIATIGEPSVGMDKTLIEGMVQDAGKSNEQSIPNEP